MLTVSTFVAVSGVVALVAAVIVGKFWISRRGFYSALSQPTGELRRIYQWIQTHVQLNPNGSEMVCWHLWLGREAAGNGATEQAQRKIAEVMAECEQVGARRNPLFGSAAVDELHSMAKSYVFNDRSTEIARSKER